MKKILFAITAALIMVMAATMVPAVNSNESDIEEYIVNTVEVKDQFQSYLESINDKAAEQMSIDKDDCSCSLNTSAYEMYGEQEYDDVPIALTFNEGGIVSDYNPEMPEDAVATDGDSTYDIIYDENGKIYDVIISVGGQDYSARDLYDPVDNCFVTVACVGTYVTYTTVCTPVAISTVCIPFIGWLIAIIMVVIVVAVVCYYYYETHHANTDEGVVYFDEEESVIDGINVGKKNGNIVAVSILGQDYKVSDNNKLNDSTATREKDNYHFALVLGAVYIFPTNISKNMAQDIMMMPDELNYNGKYSVYTCYQGKAYAICTMFGEPTLPELHGAPRNYEGYYCHYHTHDHMTPAHSFFYW